MLAAHLFKRAGIIAGCYIDVNGLAALLLPALIAARERARRSVCLNNLDEMGKGLEMYLGLYGGYYPGGHDWCALEWWNQSYGRLHTLGVETYVEYNEETGRHERIETMEEHTSWSNDDAYRYAPQNINQWQDPSCIAQGTFGSAQARGALKAAPFGLGWLLTTGAVPDPTSFYCPSARGVDWAIRVKDRNTGNPFSGVYNTAFPRGDMYTVQFDDTLREFRSAGSLTPETLTRGNWRWISQGNYGMRGYVVFSQYFYRNQPVFASAGMMNWGSRTVSTTNPREPFTILYTNPRVISTPNCPAFKTQRRLQGRSLASDSWHKGLFVTANPDGSSAAGFGDRCHKDGYNVLYGDYSTHWYSDAEQRLIWWSSPLWWAQGSSYLQGGSLGQTQQYWVAEAPDCGVTSYSDEAAAAMPYVWHLLDRAQEVDVSVDAANWTID